MFKQLVFAAAACLVLTTAASAHADERLILRETGSWATTPHGSMDIPGTQLTVKLSVYLIRGGKFVGIYWQGTKAGYVNGGQGYNNIVERFVQGHWQSANGRITLPGFGAGTVTADGRGMTFQLFNDLGAPNVKRNVFTLKMLGTSVHLGVLRHVMKRHNVQPQF